MEATNIHLAITQCCANLFVLGTLFHIPSQKKHLLTTPKWSEDHSLGRAELDLSDLRECSKYIKIKISKSVSQILEVISNTLDALTKQILIFIK